MKVYQVVGLTALLTTALNQAANHVIMVEKVDPTIVEQYEELVEEFVGRLGYDLDGVACKSNGECSVRHHGGNWIFPYKYFSSTVQCNLDTSWCSGLKF